MYIRFTCERCDMSSINKRSKKTKFGYSADAKYVFLPYYPKIKTTPFIHKALTYKKPILTELILAD